MSFPPSFYNSLPFPSNNSCAVAFNNNNNFVPPPIPAHCRPPPPQLPRIFEALDLAPREARKQPQDRSDPVIAGMLSTLETRMKQKDLEKTKVAEGCSINIDLPDPEEKGVAQDAAANF